MSLLLWTIGRGALRSIPGWLMVGIAWRTIFLDRKLALNRQTVTRIIWRHVVALAVCLLVFGGFAHWLYQQFPNSESFWLWVDSDEVDPELVAAGLIWTWLFLSIAGFTICVPLEKPISLRSEFPVTKEPSSGAHRKA